MEKDQPTQRPALESLIAKSANESQPQTSPFLHSTRKIANFSRIFAGKHSPINLLWPKSLRRGVLLCCPCFFKKVKFVRCSHTFRFLQPIQWLEALMPSDKQSKAGRSQKYSTTSMVPSENGTIVAKILPKITRNTEAREPAVP